MYPYIHIYQGIIDSEIGCGEEWEEGEDAKSFQAEKSSTFKSCLDWHLGICVGRAHAQPGWGFLGMSHITGLEASPWTLTLSLQVSSPGSLQIARGLTTKYGSEIFVKEYFFFFWHATNYENQDLEWGPPRLGNLEYGATFTVCAWTAPGGALTSSGISFGPKAIAVGQPSKETHSAFVECLLTGLCLPCAEPA